MDKDEVNFTMILPTEAFMRLDQVQLWPFSLWVQLCKCSLTAASAVAGGWRATHVCTHRPHDRVAGVCKCEVLAGRWLP